MRRFQVLVILFLLPLAVLGKKPTPLRKNHYANICPNVENLVRGAVRQEMSQTPIAAAAVLRLFFHDCFVRGCDASVMIQNPNGDDELHSSEDATLKPEGFNTIYLAKAAVDNDPQCKNKVSCADILAIAARDAVFLSGGPSWSVELGRYDGKVSTKNSVNLPTPNMNYDQLMQMFTAQNLTQRNLVALSGGHTLGATNCFFVNPRLYPTTDPNLDPGFANQLKQQCPAAFNPNNFVFFDPTVNTFDNLYFQMLQQHKGVLQSDEVLYIDPRSRSLVDEFATNQTAFFQSFTVAMTKLGRLGVKNSVTGEIRKDCRFVN